MDHNTERIVIPVADRSERWREILGIDMLISSGLLGYDRVRSPHHTLFLIKSPTVCYDQWQGTRLPAREWVPGNIGFLPAKSELRCSASLKYDESLMHIDDDLFRAAIRGDCNFSADASLRYDILASEPASKLAAVIDGIARSPLVHDRMVGETIAVALAAAVVEGLIGARMKEAPGALSDARKRRVLDYIETHLGGEITLADLADVAALSQYHFSRKFTRAFGVSPLRYVWTRRVKAAMSLLLNTSDPLADIAAACGFSSQSHFTTMFKTYVGATPARYRATARA